MPFAQLPSSPGFQQPQAPSWEPFALQANQNIERGGELRAAAGKEFSDSISKAADQISGILQFQSPEAKAQRRLQMIQTQAMTQLYNDFAQHPEKYQMTAHGPILKDGFEQALKVAHLTQAVQGIDINKHKLHDIGQQDALSQSLDQIRGVTNNYANDNSLSVNPPDARTTTTVPDATSYTDASTNTAGPSIPEVPSSD